MAADDDGIRRSPRDRAIKALLECYDGRRFCHDVLAGLQADDPLPPNDAALAAELVIGVMRHRITAEHLAAHFYRGRWNGLRRSLRVILALGTYQLCWLDRIPDHAAVDQAVRQAKRQGRGAASTVNAVLRKLARCRGDVIERPQRADPRRYLPIDDHRGRLFAENVFPDPAKKPLEHIIAVTSHPPWLVERWHRRFKPRLCRQLCEAGQRRPPLSLRANGMRITSLELAERLESAGHRPVRMVGTDAVLLPDAPPAAELTVIRDGLCQPQDSTAQIALGLSPPRPGEFVLDLCAGAGTKSTQAAELMNDQGMVFATDINNERLEQIPENAERLGLTIIRPVPLKQLEAAIADTGRRPDLILVDAPCTNTGVLARRPEARYRATHKALLELTRVQQGLLHRARDLAGPGTRIIYATCSLEPEENERLVEAFCKESPSWYLGERVFTLPDSMCDGGFAAVLRRSL